MVTPEIVLYNIHTPHSVPGRQDHVTNYLHRMLQVGRSDSLYFKNMSLLYLLFLLY